MGMTYDELSVYGRLRKPGRCGPYSMFTRLISVWNDCYSPAEVHRLNFCLLTERISYSAVIYSTTVCFVLQECRNSTIGNTIFLAYFCHYRVLNFTLM